MSASPHASALPSSLALPNIAVPPGTSAHPLLLGASPGTTGTMSLHFALVALGVSSTHYTRQFNATSGAETTTYAQGGGPVPLLRPLFGEPPLSSPAPPVDLDAVDALDLRFLEATDALLDTPSMEAFFPLQATFPNARVVLTLRDPAAWAASRRARHPSDRVPLLPLLGAPFADVRLGALSEQQAATALALWHRAAAASVAPDRLLVLDLFSTPSDELWRQLCGFLGRPLPADARDGRLPPFPHQRYGEDVAEHHARAAVDARGASGPESGAAAGGRRATRPAAWEARLHRS